MYVPFPVLSVEEILRRSAPVEIDKIKTSPSEALSFSGINSVDRFRLVNRGGKAVYIITPTKGQAVSVSADDGKAAAIDALGAKQIVEDFIQNAVAAVDGPLDFDQWIVSDEFDPYRPFYRAWTDDAHGTSLYVSAMTGEVVQRTTRRERLWNYAGAVVHWIYPTILRKYPALWDQVVWWLALVGIMSALTGGVLGIDRANKSLQMKRRQISPFQSWMRWHHILGLCAGIFVLTWIVSGWLSMDHGRLFSTPIPSASQTARFRGIALGEALGNVKIQDLKNLGSFQEAEVIAINGITILAARSAGSQRLYAIGETHIAISGVAEIPEPVIEKAVAAAWPGTQVSLERPAENDVYGHLRSGSLPPSTLRAILDDGARTWVHVDASSGRIISVMDRSRRIYRWLFNGLHSLDFPGFVDSRPAWDIVMLTLLSAGFVFSVTASVLGVKRIQKTLTKSRK